MSTAVGGVREFFNNVLYSASRNTFTPRNKFKISWINPETSKKQTAESAVAENIKTMLQAFKLYSDSVELPAMVLDGGGIINDGRGSYYYNGDYVLSPDDNTLIVYFRETQTSISDLIMIWLKHNSKPFVRPVRLNLYIDFYSDSDGKTSIMNYKAIGCIPIRCDLIKPTHDSREILLRGVKFGFHNLYPDFDALSKAQSTLIQQASQANSEKEGFVEKAGGYIGQAYDYFAGSETPVTTSTPSYDYNTAVGPNALKIKDTMASGNDGMIA